MKSLGLYSLQLSIHLICDQISILIKLYTTRYSRLKMEVWNSSNQLDLWVVFVLFVPLFIFCSFYFFFMPVKSHILILLNPRFQNEAVDSLMTDGMNPKSANYYILVLNPVSENVYSILRKPTIL